MATSGITSQVLRRVERDPGVLSPLVSENYPCVLS